MSVSELKVFVSHSNADNEFTRRLVADLRTRGATVWVDFDDIDTGDFAATINQGMDNCDWMIVVLTPASLKSKWVIMEVNAAMNMIADGFIKGVVPIVAAPFQPADLPPIWRTLQRYDATEDYDRALNGLCKALGLFLQNQNKPAQLTVNVSPSGARTFIDGVEAHGPMSISMERATKKTVVIEVSKYGYKSKRINIEVATGENRFIEIELDEQPGTAEPEKKVKKETRIDRRWQIGIPIVVIVGLILLLRPHADANNSSASNPPDTTIPGQPPKTPNTERLVQTWTPDTPITGPNGSLTSVAFSPIGNTFAAAGDDRIVRLWDSSSKKAILEFHTDHINGITSIAFSFDGKLLATGSRDSSISLWEARTGKALGSLFAGHIGPVNSVAFSPDGSVLASAGDDKTVRLWDVKSRKPIGEPLVGHTAHVNAVAFSSDGNFLATASDDKTARIWDIKSMEATGQALTGHTDQVLSVAFSPDGKTLATGSWDKTIRLWDVQTRKSLGEPLVGHEGGINALALSPGGAIIASGGVDTTVRLWDVQSRKALGQPLVNPGGEIISVAFSADGKMIAAGALHDTVQFWHSKD